MFVKLAILPGGITDFFFKLCQAIQGTLNGYLYRNKTQFDNYLASLITVSLLSYECSVH